jgi:hypothetical protein
MTARDRLYREVARLTEPVRDLGVPVPAYNGRSLPNLASSVFRAVTGRPPSDLPGILPALDPSLDPFAGQRAPGPVVVFLVDGLGWNGFRRWSNEPSREDVPWLAWARPITTIFPTTTTAALVSLSTAAAPAAHGLVGYRQYLPRFGVVADVLRMSPTNVAGQELLVHRDFRPALVTGIPTLFRRGLPGEVVSRDRFQRTGFTRILYDGAKYHGYSTAVDLAHQLTSVLGRVHPPEVVYVYWDELDTIQHLRGPAERGLFDLGLDHVASLVRYVARHLPPKTRCRTTLAITGDHGQVTAARERQIRVDRLGAITREMAHPLSGDRRAGFFAARPGRRDALESALQKHLPRGTKLFSMETAVTFGLFGPPPFHPELSARLGDFLALVPTPWGLTYLAPGAPPPSHHLLGAHGGLDPEELVVPLIAGPLDALAVVPRSGPARQR